MIKCIFCQKECKTLSCLSRHVSKCEKGPTGKLARQMLFESFYKINKDILNTEYIKNLKTIRFIEGFYNIPLSIIKFLLSQYHITQRSDKEIRKIGYETYKKNTFKKYGVENNFQRQEVVKTIQEKRNKNKKVIYENLRDSVFKKYGVYNVFQLDFVKKKSDTPERKEKQKQSKIKFYSKPENREKCSQRLLDYSLKEYGVNNPFQAQKVKDEITRICLERYGVENIFQLPEVQQKARSNLLKKYGARGFACKQIAEKIIQTLILKYGNRFGYFKRTSIHIKIEDFLKQNNIVFESEKSICRKFVDIFIEINNKIIIIEIYGDYWHANPKFYSENEIINYPEGVKLVAKKVWERDAKRKLKIISSIQKETFFIEIWEYDIRNNFQEVKKQLLSLLEKLAVVKT